MLLQKINQITIFTLKKSELWLIYNTSGESRTSSSLREGVDWDFGPNVSQT